MGAIDSAEEVTSALQQWEAEDSGGSVPGHPLALLNTLVTVIEKEIEAWYKMNPDPFDDRHPGRSDPSCTLGHVLKLVYKNDNFMNKLVNTYLLDRTETELTTVSSRLLLDLIPGLETSIIFQENEALVHNLVQWAQSASDPLRSYATGLLAAAMEVQDVAANFKESNASLVPLMLRRLYELKDQSIQEESQKRSSLSRPFRDIGKERDITTSLSSDPSKRKRSSARDSSPETPAECRNNKKIRVNGEVDQSSENCEDAVVSSGMDPDVEVILDPVIHTLSTQDDPTSTLTTTNDCSNSSWVELEQYVIGTYSMHPLTAYMKQRLILQYLQPMGEYQELLCHVFDHHALDLLFYYIDLKQNKDVRLAFEALKVRDKLTSSSSELTLMGSTN